MVRNLRRSSYVLHVLQIAPLPCLKKIFKDFLSAWIASGWHLARPFESQTISEKQLTDELLGSFQFPWLAAGVSKGLTEIALKTLEKEIVDEWQQFTKLTPRRQMLWMYRVRLLYMVVER